MKREFKNRYGFCSIIFFMLVTNTAFAIDGIKVMALSPSDKRAVLLTTAGDLLVVKPGDGVEDDQAHVVQILVDKIVLRDSSNGDMLWALKAEGEEVSDIKRFTNELDKGEIERLWDKVTEAFE